MNIQTAKVKRANRSLNQLINQVRQCRTESEECNLLNHESAEIRDLLNSNKKQKSDIMKIMGKIIFLHMLGYSTTFAQLDCINLIISDRFSHKRVGYLSAAILFDVSMETHLLLTNALKQDLNVHSSPETINLALNCLANLQSPLLLAEFIGEISLFLKSSQREVRKKAMILAGRIVASAPEMGEVFFEQSFRILSSEGKEHVGLVYPSLVLMTAICSHSPQFVELCRNSVLDNICHLLQMCLKPRTRGGYFSLDVFSVVVLLRFIAVIGGPSVQGVLRKTFSLAQTLGKFSLVHEVVLSFRRLGLEQDIDASLDHISTLLQVKQVHVRFAALTLFDILAESHPSKCGAKLDFLRQGLLSGVPPVADLSLRVICKVVSPSNVNLVVEALILYLETDCPNSSKCSCCRAILDNARRLMISHEWYVDVVLRTLRVAWKFAGDRVVGALVGVVKENSSVVGKVVAEVSGKCPPLVQAGLWCLGEFGEGREEVELVGKYGVGDMAAYGIVALTKIGLRVPALRSIVGGFVSVFCASRDVDVQQRACECLNLLKREEEDFFSGMGEILNGRNSFDSFSDDLKGPLKEMGKGPLVGMGKGPLVEMGKGPLEGMGKGPLVEMGRGPLEGMGKGPLVEMGKGPLNSRKVLDCGGVFVALVPVKREGSQWWMEFVVKNKGGVEIPGVSLKVAVPRSMSVEVSAPTSGFLSVGGEVRQKVCVTGEGSVIALKLRVEFGGRVEFVTVGDITASMWD